MDTLYGIEADKPTTDSNSAALNQKLILLIVFLILIVIRFLPYLKQPLPTFAYDYGFYLYGITHPQDTIWHSNIPGILGGLSHPLFSLTQWLRLPLDWALTGSYLLAMLALAWLIYKFYQRRDWLAGIGAVMLYAVSLVQAEAYTMFLWKNMAALVLLVLCLILLEKKSYWPSFIAALAAGLTHRTTAVLLGLTLLLYFGFLQLRQRRYKLLALELAALMLAGGAIYLLYFDRIYSLIYKSPFSISTGVFLNESNPLLVIWPILALALPGLITSLKKRENLTLLFLLLLTAVWVIIRLPFYHRVLIYLDLALIFYGGLTLSLVVRRFKYGRLLALLALTLLCFRAVSFTVSKEPLITSAQISEIQNFRQPPGYVLGMSSLEAPWLAGYLQGQNFATPCLFADGHNKQEWLDFWSGQNQEDFLKSFPRPLYLYQRIYFLRHDMAKCLKPISENFYQYLCP